jgi:hypothetical protein
MLFLGLFVNTGYAAAFSSELFRALIQEGETERADSKYPRDRVVWKQALKKVAEVDPEDLQMHYTAMLAYRGIGDVASAEREQKLFQRFKADESSQAITAKARMVSPEDNKERQAMHDHESVDLKAQKATTLDAGGAGK